MRKKKKRERENFPAKSSEAQPGPLTEQRIEGISEESSVAADWSLPLRGRQATARGGRQGAISAPEMASSTKL